MKFKPTTFGYSAPITCAVIIYHEPVGTPNRSTAAVIVMENGDAWYGVAICSDNDQFIKKTGRNKSVGRAYSSIFHKEHQTFRRVQRYDDAVDIAKAAIRLAKTNLALGPVFYTKVKAAETVKWKTSNCVSITSQSDNMSKADNQDV